MIDNHCGRLPPDCTPMAAPVTRNPPPPTGKYPSIGGSKIIAQPSNKWFSAKAAEIFGQAFPTFLCGDVATFAHLRLKPAVKQDLSELTVLSDGQRNLYRSLRV